MEVSDADRAFIESSLADLAGWVEEPVTYRTYLFKAGGDAALGQAPTAQFEDEAATAQVKLLTLRVIEASGGRYQMGDIEALIRRTAVAEQDRIQWQGVEYQPSEIWPVYLAGAAAGYRLRCKRL